VSYGIQKDSHDGEGRVITLEYPTFYLICVYVPNAGEKLKRLEYRVNEWDVEFQAYLNNLRKKKNLILCGDLNVAHKPIDIFSAKGHEKSAGFTKEERESFTKFLDGGYVDTFRYLYPEIVKFTYFSARRVTHKAENKGWRLDYFVINDEAKVSLLDSEILNEYGGSDHSPIKLTYKA
jgi:exodeoxyribonuclease III